MSNTVNPLAERALDMSLRSNDGTLTTEALVSRAEIFERYLTNTRPSLADYQDVLYRGAILAKELKARNERTPAEEDFLETFKLVHNDL